ncbi:histidinol-phosphatase [Coprinopsis marcescibilis]|uniref:Histidinol-phosphatase n=1 Tax=Coprinopsis marcescibilis TaxID=230819 RepID=A0A5C3KLE9_COPMA|nr:histidinol-phosphatase [Coprinopsis marcescibilis]
MHSHHSHSGQFCKHASGQLEEVVLEAISQQFQVYGLTEHVPRYRLDDLYPEEASVTPDDLMSQFENFLAEAHRLKTKYASQITLLVGLETEYITEADLSGLKGILEKFGHQVEYIVGSVHHVHTVPIDFDKPTYEKAIQKSSSNGDFYIAYFDAQYELFQRFKPEVIGHFDLCRLFTPDVQFSDLPLVWERIVRNIRYAANYGALFEINAAAFRKQWNTAYPGTEILQVIRSEGGKFALSDDSHGPHAVGLNYHRVLDYLKEVGVTELWYLDKTGIPNSAGRFLRPRILGGDWTTHPFWTARQT